MNYRIELQRPLRTLAAVRTYATARRARVAFCELLRECRKNGMLVVIHHGREISPLPDVAELPEDSAWVQWDLAVKLGDTP